MKLYTKKEILPIILILAIIMFFRVALEIEADAYSLPDCLGGIQNLPVTCKLAGFSYKIMIPDAIKSQLSIVGYDSWRFGESYSDRAGLSFELNPIRYTDILSHSDQTPGFLLKSDLNQILKGAAMPLVSNPCGIDDDRCNINNKAVKLENGFLYDKAGNKVISEKEFQDNFLKIELTDSENYLTLDQYADGKFIDINSDSAFLVPIDSPIVSRDIVYNVRGIDNGKIVIYKAKQTTILDDGSKQMIDFEKSTPTYYQQTVSWFAKIYFVIANFFQSLF